MNLAHEDYEAWTVSETSLWVKSRIDARIAEIKNQRLALDPLMVGSDEFVKISTKLIVMQNAYELVADVIFKPDGFDELSEPTAEETQVNE